MGKGNVARWLRLPRLQAPWWGPLLCVFAVLCGLGLGLWLRHLRAADVRQRRAQLERLQPEQAQALLRQMQRWERMSPQDRQRVEQLHQQVESSPQREQLLQAMQQFHRWLTRVPLEMQFEVLNSDASPGQRLEQFRQLYVQWLGGRHLSPEEHEALFAWWRDQLIAQRLIDPDKLRQRFPRLPRQLASGQHSPRRPGLPPVERRLLELFRRGGLMGRTREMFSRRLQDFLQQRDDEAYEELIRSWPQATAGQWRFVRTREEKQLLVLRWTRGMLLRHFFARYHRKPDQLDQLVRRFQQLPLRQKARLLELPPERFFEELQALSGQEASRDVPPGAHPRAPRRPLGSRRPSR